MNSHLSNAFFASRLAPAVISGGRATVNFRNSGAAYLPSLATRPVRRETLRLAAFLCTTPCWAARMTASGGPC